MNAQISGNRKNGLLVEALDAAETVKANRGQWYMLSRWNALIDELSRIGSAGKKAAGQGRLDLRHDAAGQLHLPDRLGRIEVYENEMSMGALIACSILAGRVNGPLIAQLPNLLVQWSYSRSSLRCSMRSWRCRTTPARCRATAPQPACRAASSSRDVGVRLSGGQSGIRFPSLKSPPANGSG